jgi:hypothetical protein
MLQRLRRQAFNFDPARAAPDHHCGDHGDSRRSVVTEREYCRLLQTGHFVRPPGRLRPPIISYCERSPRHPRWTEPPAAGCASAGCSSPRRRGTSRRPASAGPFSFFGREQTWRPKLVLKSGWRHARCESSPRGLAAWPYRQERQRRDTDLVERARHVAGKPIARACEVKTTGI